MGARQSNHTRIGPYTAKVNHHKANSTAIKKNLASMAALPDNKLYNRLGRQLFEREHVSQEVVFLRSQPTNKFRVKDPTTATVCSTRYNLATKSCNSSGSRNIFAGKVIVFLKESAVRLPKSKIYYLLNTKEGLDPRT